MPSATSLRSSVCRYVGTTGALVVALVATSLVSANAAMASSLIDTHRSVGLEQPEQPATHVVPKIALFAAAPLTLPAAGGTVELVTAATDSSICTLSSSPRATALPRVAPCDSGGRPIRVVLPRNSTARRLTYRFRLAAERGRAVADSVISVRVRSLEPSPSAPRVNLQPKSESTVAGDPVQLIARAAGAPTPTLRWQTSLNAGSTWSNITGATRSTYSTTATLSDNGSEFRAVFTNRYGSATSTAAILSVGSAPVAPSVTSEPVATTVSDGGVASFFAAASGTPTPSVDWQVSDDGGNSWDGVPWATTDTYAFQATAAMNGYEVRAVFTNSAGHASTNAATLTVTETDAATSAPAVTLDPSSTTVEEGSVATFSAAASGTPAPSVQWDVSNDGGASWSAVRGATSTTDTFSAATSESGEEFEATFTNPVGSVTTTPATLTVTTPAPIAPVITLQPASETVESGSSAVFNAGASGSPAPSVEWSASTDGGTTWSPVSGATSTTYAFTVVSADDDEEVEATFTNSGGSVTTNAATLTVSTPLNAAPTISVQPSNASAVAGTSATFTAAAIGTPTPGVQWLVSINSGSSWAEIAGATSASYAFSAVSSESGYLYEAVFTNSAGSATTNPAQLTVTPTQSTNWSGYVATGATFSSASGAWTVPVVACSHRTTYSSEWVGIDGFEPGDTTVEQDGTEADCLGGSANYDAWYEMYGDSALNDGYEVELSPATYPVQSGDAMSASVTLTNAVWTLQISDTTQSWTYSIDVASPSSAPAQSSAEWIVERPEICDRSCGLATLSTFSSVSFLNTTAATSVADQPITDFSNEAIAMVSDAQLLAEPGGLAPGGEAFTDTYG